MDKSLLAQYTIEEKYDKQKIRKNLITEIEEDFYFQIESAFNNFNLYRLLEHDHESIAQRLNRLANYTVRDWIAEIFLEVTYLQRCSIQSILGRFMDRVEDTPYRKLHALTDLIVICAQEDIFNIEYPEDSEDDEEENSITLVAEFDFDDETSEYIADTLYLPPMLVKPRKIRSVDHSPHLTRKDKCILKPKFNLHHKPMNFKMLNKLAQIPLELDANMLEYPETSSKPIDSRVKREHFNRLKQASRRVYDLIISEGNTFYLPWKPDKRGRLYSQGYHINLQANDYKKSLISFKNKVIIPKDK